MNKNSWKLVVIFFGLITLSACGSSGGDAPPPPPPPPPPATDTDNDGIPDTTDTDDDGDGVDDTDDAFPLDSAETTDTDSDGTGDNADTDDDNDGTEDANDAFPLDPNETTDSDSDGTGDNADAFPNDDTETVDSDADGTGDNADLDDDNDGTEDTADAFPFDPAESEDTDNDGTGNNADTDDDADGVADTADAFPLDATETADADSDGTGDNADTDDDNDGTLDVNDDFPLNAARTQPIQPLFPSVNGEIQLPNTQAATQLEWIVAQLAVQSTSMADIEAHFSAAALASSPASTWQGFIDNLRTLNPNGTVQEVISLNPTQLIVLIGDAADPANGLYMRVVVNYAEGTIDQFGASVFPLNGSSTRTEDQPLSYADAAAKLATVAEEAGILVARIDEQNQCVPIFEQRSTETFATASIFKIWVLGSLATAIEDGIVTPIQEVPLTADNFVLGGSINNEAVGTPFRARDFAALMLGISDNTATEHLFKLLGRVRNEAALADLNHQNIDAMAPFLSMNEAFHLYFTVPQAEALAYPTLTELEQRNYVDTVLTPLGPVTNFSQSNAGALVSALWQASPVDVCNAMAGLRLYNDRSEAFSVIDEAYGAEAAFLGLRDKWERVWFKGGSLGDGAGLRVLTYGFMLESDNRGTYAVIGMGRNDSGGNARINQAEFASVISRLVDIVDETQ